MAEDSEEETNITHVFVLKTGTVIFANRSIELEEQLSDGNIDHIVVIDAIDFPNKEDRSIITVLKKNIDYIQQLYDKDIWKALIRESFFPKCEQLVKYHTYTGMFG